MSSIPEHEKLNDFVDYLAENYIDSEAKFPISMWAEITSNSDRTTHDSFHSKFNSFFLFTPSRFLYIFININKIQINAKIAIQTATQTASKKNAFILNAIFSVVFPDFEK